MKNLHLLHTDKPSRLVLDSINNNLFLTTTEDFGTNIMEFQNIYITSNEEIKEGDWHFKNDKMVTKSHIIDDTCKKIILTTDKDLIKDGVQAISDEFLQWFVKNPSCEEVEVEEEDYSQKCRECGEIVKRGYSCKKGCFMRSGNFILTDKNIIYKIIIPKEKAKALTKLQIAKNISDIGIGKEKPKQIKCYCGHTTYCDCGPEEPKQETLEKGVDKYFKLSHSRLKNEQQKEYERELFIAGAKWQAEKMYSKEDMKKCWDACERFDRLISEGDAPNFNEFIEKFKKK
jgi:hypothetical protein